ncbi:MAG: class I SAM-dependent methyltransferase [Candidatus Diapherotrites archaeon]|uniref:Class I SAM-dependent methyltransferase n=1 Tax=Candidatus Iainarchaeum sp. TaxID=3101447 RepID=A0A8T4C611_9ARCH|nr:class I SAM-dependent methyltransferase [Candidatus Diapherotrites archaeon]
MTHDTIAHFYETYPYPHVHYFDAQRAITYAQPLLASANIRMKDLAGKTILDAGCGTGEISISMATHAQQVDAFDVSENSLTYARTMAKKLRIQNTHFFHADVIQFSSAKKYDMVTSFGVLHHTHNPEKGLNTISNCVKKNGIIIIGFYHSLGGMQQRVEKLIARVLGGDSPEKILAWLSQTKKRNFGEAEKAYWADRLANPREKYYRISLVESWLKKNGFEIIGIQGHKPDWKVKNTHNILEKWLFEMWILLHGKRFVIMAGKKI